MKTQIGARSVIFCVTLLLACSARAHPEDSPLTFFPHRTDNGAVIFSNIPKKCFRDGVLLCARYHPLFSQGQSGAKQQSAE